MSKKNQRVLQTRRFLKWIRKYSGWWYLICTPGEAHMTLDTMKLLVRRLYQEGFYELIFVLLMVHRDSPILSHKTDYLLLDSWIARWDTEHDHIIQELQALLE